jgi:CRP-like cAMP-binding protein
MRKTTRIIKDNLVTIEEEKKVGEAMEGDLIGENALLKPDKNTRALSAMAKTDCIFLLLSLEAFDILVRVKILILIRFIYTNRKN